MSTDLIHWTRLPPPVRPNRTDPRQWYDHSGSYDGGVSLLPPTLGGPTIVYDVIECAIRRSTGKCGGPAYVGCKCINDTDPEAGTPMDPPWMGVARPVNTSDPYLLEWAKDPSNPINFTGGPGTGGANPGSIWWNDRLKHFNLLALSHAGGGGASASGGGAAAAAVGLPMRGPLTTGTMFRYETTDPTFHNWTRKGVFAGKHSGMGGQWFMRLPPTVDGSTPPPGTPTHIITSGDGGGFAFGDYDEATDEFVAAPAAWTQVSTQLTRLA